MATENKARSGDLATFPLDRTIVVLTESQAPSSLTPGRGGHAARVARHLRSLASPERTAWRRTFGSLHASEARGSHDDPLFMPISIGFLMFIQFGIGWNQGVAAIHR